MKCYPTCLSIAGSDPSGGAGIQADLKTFSALGCYGAAAITALTVQNTTGVTRSVPVDAGLVYEQAAAVMADLRPQAVKIGMTVNAETISALVKLLTGYRPDFIVLDPVMVSSSGRSLLDKAGVEALVSGLMPLCSLVTPNLHELEVLTGTADAVSGGRELLCRTGCKAVLVKGGHRHGQPTDSLIAAETTRHFPGQRIHTRNDHGTGCTLSSAITAFISRGYALPEAVRRAKDYVEQALAHGADVCIGQGNGAMNHFYAPKTAIVLDV